MSIAIVGRTIKVKIRIYKPFARRISGLGFPVLSENSGRLDEGGCSGISPQTEFDFWERLVTLNTRE